MARGTPDLPSEAGSPKLWERFFFQTRETRSGWGGLFERERDRERTRGEKGKGQKTKMRYEGDEWSQPDGGCPVWP